MRYDSCNFFTFNGFYTYLLCFFGAESLGSWKTIILAVILNTVRDCCFILLTFNIFKKRSSTLIFTIFLALHPYLALYHFKLMTTNFAALGFLLILFIIVKRATLNPLFYLTSVLLTGFRNALFPVFLIFNISTYFKNKEYFSNKQIILSIFFSLLLIGVFFLPSFDTEVNGHKNLLELVISNSQSFPFTFAKLFSYLRDNLSIESSFIIGVISIFAFILIHIFLQFGFRDSVAIYGFEFYHPLTNLVVLEISISLIMAVLHLVGFVKFFSHFARLDFRILVLIIYLLESLFFIPHLRYFLPFIPLVLMGLCLLFEGRKKINL